MPPFFCSFSCSSSLHKSISITIISTYRHFFQSLSHYHLLLSVYAFQPWLQISSNFFLDHDIIFSTTYLHFQPFILTSKRLQQSILAPEPYPLAPTSFTMMQSILIEYFSLIYLVSLFIVFRSPLVHFSFFIAHRNHCGFYPIKCFVFDAICLILGTHLC